MRAALIRLKTGSVESNRLYKSVDAIWTFELLVPPPSCLFDSRAGFGFNPRWAYDDVGKKVLCVTLGSTNNTTAQNVFCVFQRRGCINDIVHNVGLKC